MKKFIHERENWTDMKHDDNEYRDSLIQFYKAQSRLFGKLDALGFEVHNNLILSAVSDEVVASSEIEGEILNRSSVRSSVAKRLGLELAGVDDVITNHYTEGVVEMALDATQKYTEKITDERLFGWHAALFPSGWSGMNKITVGAYRLDEMSIVSGELGKETVHYIAPAPDNVPGEMKKFLKWLEDRQNTDPYVKAAIAHFWFETIHPFDDGNGRIGRAIADSLLARAENNSKRYYSLSSQILKEKKAYYSELEFATDYFSEVGRWVKWFLDCLTHAVEASEEKLEKAMYKTLVFDRLRKTAMNERQLMILNKLIEGFDGKLTTTKWAKLCKCSHDTALRDIDDLIKKGVLVRSPGGGRSTSYELLTIE